MNALLETQSRPVTTSDFRHAAKVIRKACQISLNRGSATPLWVQARVRTIDFRRAELVRTHWKKLGRSMLDD